MCSGLLLVRKQKLCDLYKTIFVELEMINKNDDIVVAMTTMTFQYGRHFAIELILLEKMSGYPHFLFHEKFFTSIMEYLNDFKKIL
jgi:hemerythrin